MRSEGFNAAGQGRIAAQRADAGPAQRCGRIDRRIEVITERVRASLAGQARAPLTVLAARDRGACNDAEAPGEDRVAQIVAQVRRVLSEAAP